MKIRELTQAWERTAKGRVTRDSYAVHLTLEDAARLEALHEMYPKRQIEDIITDLLGAALEELEASLPYRAGKEVIAVDEMGDPLYKDEGPTPRYLERAASTCRSWSSVSKKPSTERVIRARDAAPLQALLLGLVPQGVEFIQGALGNGRALLS